MSGSAAPGPYETIDIGAHTSFHSYVVDANGRKIGVVWGPKDEKVWTAALFAASFDMLAALVDAEKRLRGAGMFGGDDDPVRVAITKATGQPA